MVKLPTKRKPILRIVVLSIAAVPVLFILYVLFATFVITPSLEAIDNSKFEKLDEQSRQLYEQVKAVSGGAETWKYTTSCYEQKTGDWPTGIFTCSTLLSSDIAVISAAQVNVLHEKYYPVIDSASMLKPQSELNKQYPGAFGVTFVVSSAEKFYKFSEDDSIDCTYITKLYQSSNDADFGYGLEIKGGIGDARISLECSGEARGHWYQLRNY
jgi:hypothetical protein